MTDGRHLWIEGICQELVLEVGAPMEAVGVRYVAFD